MGSVGYYIRLTLLVCTGCSLAISHFFFKPTPGKHTYLWIHESESDDINNLNVVTCMLRVCGCIEILGQQGTSTQVPTSTSPTGGEAWVDPVLGRSGEDRRMGTSWKLRRECCSWQLWKSVAFLCTLGILWHFDKPFAWCGLVSAPWTVSFQEILVGFPQYIQ